MHMRVVSPASRTPAVLAALDTVPDLTNLVVVEGAARRPAGDLILVDVPNETANHVVRLLRARGLEHLGSITIDRSVTVLSDAADLATADAPGASSEAVVWAEIETRALADSEVTVSFVLMTMLATLIAAVGILSDSLVLIVGAMVISPEYGPLIGIAIGVFRRRRGLLGRSARAFAIAVLAGLVVALVLALGVNLLGATPEAYLSGARPLTSFISHPDGWSVAVSLLAGLAGAISLTQSRSNALVGVFISVTTIPAVANIAVALSHGRTHEAAGALLQLALNVVLIVFAGVTTLWVELAIGRRLHRRRRSVLP